MSLSSRRLRRLADRVSSQVAPEWRPGTPTSIDDAVAAWTATLRSHRAQGVADRVGWRAVNRELADLAVVLGEDSFWERYATARRLRAFGVEVLGSAAADAGLDEPVALLEGVVSPAGRDGLVVVTARREVGGSRTLWTLGLVLAVPAGPPFELRALRVGGSRNDERIDGIDPWLDHSYVIVSGGDGVARGRGVLSAQLGTAVHALAEGADRAGWDGRSPPRLIVAEDGRLWVTRRLGWSEDPRSVAALDRFVARAGAAGDLVATGLGAPRGRPEERVGWTFR